MVKQALNERKREELWKKIQSNELLVQIKNLQILTFGMEGFPDLPFEKIKELYARRNVLAHGHYIQDLFNDEYKIIGRTKDTVVTILEIKAPANLADEISREIEGAMAHFWFEVLAEVDEIKP